MNDPMAERCFHKQDLGACPYCRADKRRGLVAELWRTRLPGGVGSELATFAAEIAAAGGAAAPDDGYQAMVPDVGRGGR